MKIQAIKDTRYNLDGGWKGRRSASKGEVHDVPDNVGERLLNSNDWELPSEAPTKQKVSQPSENKVVAPKENKVTYEAEHVGFGNYEITDGRGNVEYKIKGKKKAQAKLKELNGE